MTQLNVTLMPAKAKAQQNGNNEWDLRLKA